jgi:hypothetical protein
MSNEKQQPTEIDETSLEQAVGGLNFTKPGLATNNKALKYNPDQGKMAEQDNGYVPDLPDQPVFR